MIEDWTTYLVLFEVNRNKNCFHLTALPPCDLVIIYSDAGDQEIYTFWFCSTENKINNKLNFTWPLRIIEFEVSPMYNIWFFFLSRN